MKKEPLVSILIPLYNSEKYIAQTLDCAINQTWKNKEIIVVDDGSTDNSLAIARSYECDVLKVYSQQNKGAGAARNYAFSNSSGDYIQYLDADDLLEPGKIEKQINFINNSAGIDINNSLLYCDVNLFEYHIEKVLHNNYTIRCTSYLNPWNLLTDMYLLNKAILPHAYLTPRKLIVESGGWNESLSTNDDGEFFSRVISRSCNVIFTPGIYVYYRIVPESLSRRRSEKHAYSELKSIILTAELMLNNDDSVKVKSACSRRLNLFIQDWYPENMKMLNIVELFMRKYHLEYNFSGKSKKYILLVKHIGWRRTLGLKIFVKSLFKK